MLKMISDHIFIQPITLYIQPQILAVLYVFTDFYAINDSNLNLNILTLSRTLITNNLLLKSAMCSTITCKISLYLFDGQKS